MREILAFNGSKLSEIHNQAIGPPSWYIFSPSLTCRVLQLLPGAERPSYAGLHVEVLERADADPVIRYQGETVDFQEGDPPASSLWGEGTGRSPTAVGSGAGASLAVTYLDET